MALSKLYSAGSCGIAAIGFLADIEKYFEAALAGWTVFRLSERQLTFEAVERIVKFIAVDTRPAA